MKWWKKLWRWVKYRNTPFIELENGSRIYLHSANKVEKIESAFYSTPQGVKNHFYDLAMQQQEPKEYEVVKVEGVEFSHECADVVKEMERLEKEIMAAFMGTPGYTTCINCMKKWYYWPESLYKKGNEYCPICREKKGK